LTAIYRKSTKSVVPEPRFKRHSVLLSEYPESVFIINITINPAMSLTLSDVNRIAKLAQLEMSEAQSATALAQLNGIFALAEQMQAVDTEGVAR
jgi:hypothetical protein